MAEDWELQVILPVAGCVALVGATVSGYILYQRSKKRKEPLFGSTIKTLPPNQGLFSEVPVPVQPSDSGDQQSTTFCPTVPFHGASYQGEHRNGLSSEHARWTSMDKNSEHSDDESHSGTVWRLSFKLQYDSELHMVKLTIFRAKCFPEKYSTGLKTAVHVTVYLLPEETQKQTAPYPNTGSPSFDETFNFHVPPEELASKSLRCSLYELDHSRMRICLGHTLVKLADIPRLEGGETHYFDKDLEHLSSALEEPGPEIHLSLSYNTQTEKLKIQLFAARNLPEMPSNNQYILSTNVIVGTKTVKTKRTEACTSLYGLFQCSYAFQIPSRHMDTCCLQFKVLEVLSEIDRERQYGQITIGPCMYAHGSGLEHWKQMLANTKKSVEMWHKLILS